MATWADIQRGIFAGESGGDYGALFNYQNRPDGRFSNVDLTQMTIDDALQFSDPSGPYAQYVKGQVGRVATPMGAYQVVGTTLRAAKQGLGLTGNERMTPELQDRIGQWIYETQGTGAWEGYKGPRVKTREGSVMDDNTMNAQNAQAQATAAQAAAQEQSGSDKFREVAGNLAIAFNSMRLNPDPNIASSIRDIRDARTEKQAKNKTLAYLEKIGRGDLVSAIEAGLSPKAAISQMFTEAAELRGFERQKELAKFEAGLTSGKDTASIREYNLAKSQGFQGTFADWQQSGKRRTEVGTIPQGYQLVEARNDKGETVLRMEPIAGGPADIEARELAGKAEKRAGSQQTMTDTILNEAEKARGLINNWSTGAGAFLLQGLPLTEARQLVGHVKSLQAQATIETLNAMRQESPTGGALGNVTNQENAMLAAKAGLLDPMSKPEVFKQQLDDYERTLLRIVHGPEEGDKIFSQSRLGSVTAQPGQTAQPMSDDDLLTKYGTPVQGKP